MSSISSELYSIANRILDLIGDAADEMDELDVVDLEDVADSLNRLADRLK